MLVRLLCQFFQCFGLLLCSEPAVKRVGGYVLQASDLVDDQAVLRFQKDVHCFYGGSLAILPLQVFRVISSELLVHSQQAFDASLALQKLVLDWKKRTRTRADVQVTIEDILYKKLPEPKYTPEIKQEKTILVYQHVYDSYSGAGQSVYT
jgi:hypothetical protein